MAKLPKIVIVLFILLTFSPVYGLEIENTADNPRLINLAPSQFKALDVMEKRIYNTTFDDDNNLDRIERLEMDYFNEIRTGSATQRINSLKIASGQAAIRGTAMTPMMMETFNTRYINQHPAMYHDDVGIIDGLIRVWWPDFYETLRRYREYKEANFYQYN